MLAGLACCLLPAGVGVDVRRPVQTGVVSVERRASCMMLHACACGPEEAEQDVDVAQFTTCLTTCPLLSGVTCFRFRRYTVHEEYLLASHIGSNSNPHVRVATNAQAEY